MNPAPGHEDLRILVPEVQGCQSDLDEKYYEEEPSLPPSDATRHEEGQAQDEQENSKRNKRPAKHGHRDFSRTS